MAGLDAARAKGKIGGRPTANDADIKMAIALYDTGKYSVKEICKKTKICHATLYKYLRIRNEEEEMKNQSTDGDNNVNQTITQ
jgi:DNA invertase Pin-like site-specific DNA recombinase